jgi:hypothetical protein
MSATLKLLSVSHPSIEDVIEIWFQIIPAGNYAANGDVINFGSLDAQVSTEGSIVDADLVNNMPIGVHVDSQTGGWGASGGGYYEIQTYKDVSAGVATPLTPSTCKFRCFAAGGSELGAGAYDATITGDYIVCIGRWPRKP